VAAPAVAAPAVAAPAVAAPAVAAPAVAAPAVAAPAVAAPSVAWTADQNAWVTSKFAAWQPGVLQRTANYWRDVTKEFFALFGLRRSPNALRKQASLLKLRKPIQLQPVKTKKIILNCQQCQPWPQLVEQWINDHVPGDSFLSSKYLQSVAKECKDHLQHTGHTDIVELISKRSLSAWSQKIKRMRRLSAL